ncbi:MAG: heat shock protein HspQ [Acidiferrobacterales bacterium]
MRDSEAKFHVGQLVHHKLFDYRGVIADVDPTFQGTEEWYEQMARSRPPKDKPWYRVLVDNAEHETYVAERNLEPDKAGGSINHPLVDQVFDEFRDGRYIARRSIN